MVIADLVWKKAVVSNSLRIQFSHNNKQLIHGASTVTLPVNKYLYNQTLAGFLYGFSYHEKTMELILNHTQILLNL